MIGVVVALVCARFIEGMLYGVTAADPISLLIAVMVLAWRAASRAYYLLYVQSELTRSRRCENKKIAPQRHKGHEEQSSNKSDS